jgi:hypothetical protein
MPTENSAAAAGVVQPKTVRGCDGCTLCCKVMEVAEIAKPAGQWCQHCQTGIGCAIYATRPLACSAYVCGYLTIPELTEEWKPAVSRLVLPSLLTDGTIVIYVDPARPDAWRRAPYYATLKEWSRQGMSARRRVVVRVGRSSIVILPDHAVDLGEMAVDEMIVVTSSPAQGAAAPSYEAYAVKREAWEKVAPDAGLRKMVMPDAAGFRAGRHVG